MGTGIRTSHSLSEELSSELVTDGGFASVTEGSEQIIGDDGDFDTIGNWGVQGSSTLTAGYDSGDSGHEACLRIESGDATYEGAILALNNLAGGIPAVGSTVLVGFDYKWISKTESTWVSLGSGDGLTLSAAAGSWNVYSSYIQIVNTNQLFIYSSRTGGAATDELLIDNVSVKLITLTSFSAGTGWGPQAISGALTGKASKIAGTASDLVQATAAGDIATDVVTLANMRISAVAGTSFVDFSAAAILTGNIGKVLTIKDSAGKVISGYIKAAGTGETLDSELITAWTNAPGSDWDTLTTDGKNIIEATEAGSNAYAGAGDLGIVIGACYKFVHTFSIAAGTAPVYYLGSNGAGEYPTGQFYYGLGTLPVGTTTKYFTGDDSDNDHLWFVSPGAVTTCVLTPSGKKVLTPSATGVTIVSTLDGSTYNWTYQQTGFNYNDASGYTYYIDDIKVNRIAATVVRTDGTLNSDLDEVDGASITADGTYYDYLIAGAGVLSYQAAADFAGSIDAVSCKEVVRRGTPD